MALLGSSQQVNHQTDFYKIIFYFSDNSKKEISLFNS